MHLSAHESRVLGVLVEKAHTTPAQYPITLNALTSGCNQKNNRDPVVNYGEDLVLETLDSLRAKGLVREVMLSGSRVAKYRHHAREVLEVETAELVILAELLMRGPQTVGELRTRASRMHPLDSLEGVEAVLQKLAGREEPLVERHPPSPGSRAPRWAQRLSPGLHSLGPSAPEQEMRSPTTGSGAASSSALAERVERLEAEVASLREKVQRLAEALGE